MAKKRSLIKTEKLFTGAKKYLVGGVNSPVRSFNYVGTNPLLIKNGKGSRVFDYDGNSYIDYVMSWGALILGHTHSKVVKDLKTAITKGLGFGTTNKAEIELAEIISNAIPLVEKTRFVNSGTESVMSALRLARGYTGRDKIVKFENSYHGHADYLLANAGSGLATLNIPASAGVPKEYLQNTLISPYGDKKSLEKLFKEHGDNIAAVIFEPIGGNHGVILPDLNFLKYLQRLAKKYKVLLIADETITGFRFEYGLISEKLGLKPDLVCLGKIIGGGLPIGAYGGKKEIMDHLAPLGNVYQAGTFSGNPIVMQSGISTLKTLKANRSKYKKLNYLAGILSRGIQKLAQEHRVDLKVVNFGSILSLKFAKKEEFVKVYRSLLEGGVYFAPSEFEANFLSFSHTKKDVLYTLKVIDFALGGKE